MATRITIEQGGDANKSGRMTIVEIQRTGELYQITASKTGDPAQVHRKFIMPRQAMPLYRLLTDVFARLST